MINKINKISVLTVLLFTIFVFGTYSVSFASVDGTINIIDGDRATEIDIHYVNMNDYFILEDFAKLIGANYKVNGDNTAYIATEKAYISGEINSEEGICKIKKDGIKTPYAAYDSPFYGEGELVYIKADLAMSVFTENYFEYGVTEYDLHNEESVKLFKNTEELNLDTYTIIGNIVYVELEEFKKLINKSGATFNIDGDKLYISSKNGKISYTVPLNSNKNLIYKYSGQTYVFDSPYMVFPFTKVDGKYYLDITLALTGTYSIKNGGMVYFYETDEFKKDIIEKYDLGNFFNLMDTLTNMDDFDSSSSMKMHMLDSYGEYKDAGVMNFNYSRKNNMIYMDISSNDEGNSDSPFYYDEINGTAIIDINDFSTYEKTDNGFWYKTSDIYGNDEMRILNSLTDSEELVFNYLDFIYMESMGDMESFQEYNEMVLKIVGSLFNDDLLVKNNKGYKYSLDFEKLLGLLFDNIDDDNYIIEEIYNEISSGGISIDLKVDLEINMVKNKIKNIKGFLFFEVDEYDKNGIKINFASVIKSPSQFEMPSEDLILEY